MPDATEMDLRQLWAAQSFDGKLRTLTDLRRRGMHLVALSPDFGMTMTAMHAVIAALERVDWTPGRLSVEQRRHIMKVTGWMETDMSHASGPGPGRLEESRGVLQQTAVGGGALSSVGAALDGEDVLAPVTFRAVLNKLRVGAFDPSPKNLKLLDEWLGLPRAPLNWRLKRFGVYYKRKVIFFLAGYAGALVVTALAPAWAGPVLAGIFLVVLVLAVYALTEAKPAPSAMQAARAYAGGVLEPLKAAPACPHCRQSVYLHPEEECPKFPEPEPEPPPAVETARLDAAWDLDDNLVRVELITQGKGMAVRLVHLVSADGVERAKPVYHRWSERENGRRVERHEINESAFVEFYDTHVQAVEGYLFHGRLLLLSDRVTPEQVYHVPRDHKMAVVRALKSTEGKAVLAERDELLARVAAAEERAAEEQLEMVEEHFELLRPSGLTRRVRYYREEAVLGDEDCVR